MGEWEPDEAACARWRVFEEAASEPGRAVGSERAEAEPNPSPWPDSESTVC